MVHKSFFVLSTKNKRWALIKLEYFSFSGIILSKLFLVLPKIIYLLEAKIGELLFLMKDIFFNFYLKPLLLRVFRLFQQTKI